MLSGGAANSHTTVRKYEDAIQRAATDTGLILRKPRLTHARSVLKRAVPGQILEFGVTDLSCGNQGDTMQCEQAAARKRARPASAHVELQAV